MIIQKPIKSTSDVKEITITNEFGFEEKFKVNFTTYINLDTYDPVNCENCKNGIPELQTIINLQPIGIKKTNKFTSRTKMIEAMKGRNIIPPLLKYDNILVGFVYSDATDPNNHKWWLDFRDKQDQNIYNIYSDELDIFTPITTRAWHDNIWHGRYVISNKDIISIQNPKSNKLVIVGNKVPIDSPTSDNVCSIENVPSKTKWIKARYNIIEDIWFCDFIDSKGNTLRTTPAKRLLIDAPMYGVVEQNTSKPKTSIKINLKDISDISIALDSLIIRGISN